MPIVETGGRRIGYAETGQGPLVLFAHCSLGQAGLWKGVMAALAPRWRCVALDLPGHGRTDRGDEELSLQDEALADLAHFARLMGNGRAHLVGLSLGGAIVGRAAARRPAMARSVTMIEPIMMHLLKDSPQDMTAENDAIMGPVVAACREGRYEDGARAFMDGWGQPGQFERFPPEA
ncbi:MAG: alpha/beta fold hydrolase, partial [Pseudomonadota bacterium]